MVKTILKFFMDEQHVQSVLSSPIIETIFFVLFVTFILAIFIHFSLYGRLRRIRNHIKSTNSLDIAPLNKFKAEFEIKNKEEAVKVETFIEKKFSSWRVFHVPVVNLIKMIQMTVSVFILLGVLGTFIGLTMSLSSIDVSGDGLVDSVGQVLGGLDVAFYTSIAGMTLSLIMTIVTKVANAEYMLTDIMLKTESYLEENEQDSMARLIQVSESINSSIGELAQSFRGFQDYTDGLQQSAKDLSKFNKGLAVNLKDFHTLFTQVKDVTSDFDKGATMLNKNFDQLFCYFSKMDQRNEQITTAANETYKKMQDLSTAQSDTLNNFQHAVADMKDFFSSIAERQESIHSSFERMNAQSENLAKIMKENNQQLKGIFGDDLSSKLVGINLSLRDLKGDFDKISHSLVRLPDALDTINNTQAEYKNLLSGRFEELKQFNHEFNSHLKAHSQDSQTFEKHMNDAARSYEQLSIKNNQLLNEINRTVSQVTDSFNQRENQIESTVSILKDTLSRYVANLEGGLGDKLDKVSRNIGDYVVDMNEAIKKEFKQIGDITEDQQQRNSRYIQQTMSDLGQEIQNLNRHLQVLSQEASRQSHRVRVGIND